MKPGLDPSEIDADFLQNLAQMLADQLGQSIETITEEEIQAYLEVLLSETPDSAEYTCVHTQFERQAAATPDAPALIVDDPALSSAQQRLSYAALNRRANQLARYLARRGVGTGLPVAVYLPRSIDQVVALLAVLKTGATYLALDGPPAYRAAIIAATRPHLVLTHERLAVTLPSSMNCICLDTEQPQIARETAADHAAAIELDAPAYLVYTSGRALEVDQRGLANRLQWLQASFALSARDRLLTTAAVTLDAAIWELLWPLSCGASVVLSPAEPSAATLLETIDAQQVSVLHLTPVALRELLDATDRLPTADLSALQHVLCSGAALRRATVERFFQHSRARLSYVYGPPGAAALVTAQTCEPRVAQALLPIGQPSSNLSVYVLDSFLQPVPTGVIGELCIAGSPLARGYLHDPEATDQRFVANPFVAGDERLLRTGDRARRLSDGSFELVSSGARQVWLDGFCVELDWLAAELLADGEIEQCVVLARETTETQLVAYVVPSGVFVESSLRAQAEARLPRQLVPSAYVPLSSLPLLTNGQIDERALVSLPVLDAALIEQWETNLHATLASEQVAVVAQPAAGPAATLDLHAIQDMPGWDTDDTAVTLPDWFFRTIWRRKELILSGQRPATATYLLFIDHEQLGGQLVSALRTAGQRCIVVQPGDSFVQRAANHYQIDPAIPTDYRALIEALADQNLLPERIIHLWTYHAAPPSVDDAATLEQMQRRGGESLLNITHALAQFRADDTVLKLWVVSSQIQPTSDEPLVYGYAPLLGLLKTIPQEAAWLECRHIDLPFEQPNEHVAYVLGELRALGGEREVAYRRRQRLIPRLEQVDLSDVPAQTPPFKPGGTYLISGGLGGIGVEIASALLQHYQARLLLIGRTELPDEADTSAEPHTGRTVQRYERYGRLAALGGQIRYAAVDICDHAALQQAVAAALDDWQCQLDGIVQVAGSVEERVLDAETPARLAELLRPFVSGTWNLHSLLAEHPHSLFISFASVNGFFGGATIGAYTAANTFLERFAHQQRTIDGQRSFCYAWSIWEGIGISQQYQMQDRSLARGYELISPAQGWRSLLLGMAHNQPALLIGLNSNNPHVRRQLETPGVLAHALTGYIAGQPSAEDLAKLAALHVVDRFGTPARCTLVAIDELPRDEHGLVDRQRLSLIGRGRHLEVDYVAPRNELERQLATIWQEVLGVQRIGIHDKFFEMGGDSVLAIQLIARSARLGLRLSAEQVFRHQSIAQLATVAATNRQIQAEQGRVTGLVPLTPAQYFFFEHDLPVPDHFNQAFLFEARAPIDLDRLEQVLHHLVEHHDALRLRFTHTEHGWQQRIADDEPSRLSTAIDLAALAEAERWPAFEARATELQRSLSLADGPLLGVLVGQRGINDLPLVLIVIHHLVVDGLSWRILLEDLQTAYEQLSQGQPIQLPPKTTSFKHWAERLSSYAQTAEPRAELDYWLAQTWPQNAGIPHDRPGANSELSAANVSLDLSPAETQRLLTSVPRRCNVQITDAMLTAMVQSYARWTGERSLLVEIAHHGRKELFEDVDLSRTVGWFSTFHPIVLDLGTTADPLAELQAVKRQLMAVPQQGFNYLLLRHLSGDEQISARLAAIPRPQVLLTYLGQFDQVFSDTTLLKLIGSSVGPIHHPEGTRMYQLVFNQLVADEQLGLGLTYSDELHERATAERLAHGYLDALRTLIARCDER